MTLTSDGWPRLQGQCKASAGRGAFATQRNATQLCTPLVAPSPTRRLSDCTCVVDPLVALWDGVDHPRTNPQFQFRSHPGEIANPQIKYAYFFRLIFRCQEDVTRCLREQWRTIQNHSHIGILNVDERSKQTHVHSKRVIRPFDKVRYCNVTPSVLSCSLFL